MDNKKERSEFPRCEEDSNDRTTFSIHSIQFGDLAEIKQDGDIKPETVSVGELVDIPASTYRVAKSNGLGNGLYFSGLADEYDFDFQSLDEAKVEMKANCDDKKEEETNTNVDCPEESAENQPNQRDKPSHDDGDLVIPEIDDNLHNIPEESEHDEPPHDEVDMLVPESDDSPHDIPEQIDSAHENPHKCDSCEFSAQFESSLKRHLLKHTGERPFGCDSCPKQFTTKQILQTHMKAHVSDFPFHCSGCLQGFNEEDQKKAHEVICQTLRYECYVCKGSIGSDKTTMVIHMRVHSGDRPFKCQQCFKHFTKNGNLHRHRKIHAHLNKHMNRVHNKRN
ncbi:zinc finger protein 239-like [Sitodiplosis mosellana]|uniref:zinc finger protein 239-like n=1 Tax=Sitodiplosis mosellana TaxID=263140 RepID=UPI002444DD78|nr:zinc finger protein 239-like [Sitodiplosis mosellana]